MDPQDISVIVPCRNAAPFILECLRSVASQTRPGREIIVADDHSADESVAVVREHFPEARIIEGNFGGASGARNAAIASAAATWIAFVDADDRWYPDHLERALALLVQSGDPAYLGHFDLLSEEGHTRAVPTLVELRTTRMHLGLDDFLELFSKGLPNASASYVVKRTAVAEIAGFDESQVRANDLDFWLRLVSKHSWCYDPHPAVCYRLRTSGNLSQDVASRSFFRLRAFLQLRKTVPVFNPTLQRLIDYWAQQALRTAAIRGGRDDWQRAVGLAAPELAVPYLLFWRGVALARYLAPGKV